jgi:hypothetical protein
MDGWTDNDQGEGKTEKDNEMSMSVGVGGDGREKCGGESGTVEWPWYTTTELIRWCKVEG